MLIAMLFVRCEVDDDLSSADRNTVSDGSVTFEEILMLINVKTNDSTYLVVQSVDSVKIYINDYYWTSINSQLVDTSKVDKEIDGVRFVTGNKLNYLVIADQEIEQPEYTTAGDYAAYLNAAYELEPGEYACMIESFQVTFNDQSTQTYYPFAYKMFVVEDDTRSASVGEFELNIY